MDETVTAQDLVCDACGKHYAAADNQPIGFRLYVVTCDERFTKTIMVCPDCLAEHGVGIAWDVDRGFHVHRRTDPTNDAKEASEKATTAPLGPPGLLEAIAEFTDWVERTGGISGPVARDGESK